MMSAVRCLMAALTCSQLASPLPVYAQERATQQVREYLTIRPARIAIGSQDREGPDLFGSIAGVTMDTRRNVYVLDGSEQHVRVFSASGQHIGTVGRPGRGPGDLRDAMAVWHDGESSLFVVDRYDGISIFTTAGNRFRFERRIGADLRPTAVCTIGQSVFVAGTRSARILHSLRRTGEVMRSFGAPFRRDSMPGIQEVHDRADLVVMCDGRREQIVVAEGAQNKVRAYATDGSLRWESALPAYDGYAVGINRQPRGIAVFWGTHLTRTILPVGGDLLLVQVSQQSRRRDPRRLGALAVTDTDIITYVLSATGGGVLARGSAGPLVSLTRGGETVGYRLEPFPQAYLLQLAPR